MRGASALTHPRALPTRTAAQGAAMPQGLPRVSSTPIAQGKRMAAHALPKAPRPALASGRPGAVLSEEVSPKVGAPRALPPTPNRLLRCRLRQLTAEAPPLEVPSSALPPRPRAEPRRPDQIPDGVPFIIPYLRSNDAETGPPTTPADTAKGKFISLLHPQELARRVLPKAVFQVLLSFATARHPLCLSPT
jgi:hypothetical protein